MNKIEQAQAIVREASPGFLADFNRPYSSGVVRTPAQSAGNSGSTPDADTCPKPGPSTLAELAEALRNPLPPAPPKPRCYSALEAAAVYKPLTMEMVRDLMAKERAAREVIMKEYTERTGQAVDYCEECDLGVVEEEVEEKYGTRVDSVPCTACDGLGVVAI